MEIPKLVGLVLPFTAQELPYPQTLANSAGFPRRPRLRDGKGSVPGGAGESWAPLGVPPGLLQACFPASSGPQVLPPQGPPSGRRLTPHYSAFCTLPCILAFTSRLFLPLEVMSAPYPQGLDGTAGFPKHSPPLVSAAPQLAFHLHVTSCYRLSGETEAQSIGIPCQARSPRCKNGSKGPAPSVHRPAPLSPLDMPFR